MQNKNEMLRIQYCARHCYNFAEVVNAISWVLCVISSVVLNLPCVTERLTWGIAVVSAIVTIMAIVIDFWKNHFLKLGSALKKRFDYILFGFEVSDGYDGFCENDINRNIGKIITRYPKSYQKQISHSGTDKPKGVKDWYNNISSELSLDEAIQKCQRETLYFDTTLVNFAQWVYIILFALIIIILMLLNLESSLFEVFINVCSMISLFIKLGTEIFSTIKLNATVSLIKSLSYNNMLEPQVIQRMIDKRRNADVIIPRIIYMINSRFLHLSYKNSECITVD